MPSSVGRLSLYIIINTTYVITAIAYTIIQGNQMSYNNRMESAPIIDLNSDVAVSFSHFHMYVDNVDNLATYKSLEAKLNIFDASLAVESVPLSAEDKKTLWRSLGSDDGKNRNDDVAQYTSQNRDVIRQLIAGLGFRVTGYVDHASTRSVLVSSRDTDGVQIMISAMKRTIGSSDHSGTSAAREDMCDYGES